MTTKHAHGSLTAEQPGRTRHMRDAAGTRDPETLPITCRCGTRWAGSNTSHCGACHHTFGGVTLFDEHRRNGTCLTPEEAGMTLISGRAYECWGHPTA